MAAPYSNATVKGICEDVLTQLSSLTTVNDPFTIGRKTGALDFYTSDINGGIKSELIKTGTGKLRQARVVYSQRTADCQVLTGTDAMNSTICDSRIEDFEKEVTVDISYRIASRPRQFSKKQLFNVCQDINVFMQKYLLSDMRALREQLSKQLIILADAGSGVNYLHNGGSAAAGASKSLDLIDDSGTQSLPLSGNFVEMLLNYENNNLQGVPVVIGEGNFYKYSVLADLACCNSSTPYADAIGSSGVAFFHDQATHAAIGPNEILVMAPDVSHLLWWNENEIFDNGFANDFEAHIVVPDPVNPRLMWDWDFYWDKCGGIDSKGAYVYQISAYYDIFNAIQTDAFRSSTSPSVSPTCADELDGMTGIFKYVIT